MQKIHLISRRLLLRKPLLIVVALFSLLGTITLLSSHAATSRLSMEPETGAVTGPAQAVSDTSASAGKSIKFGGDPAADSSIYWGALMSGKTYCGCTAEDVDNAPWAAATWDTFEQHASKKVSLVSWGQRPPWFEDFMTTPFQLVNDRGAISFYIMSTEDTSQADIAAGKYDVSIIKWTQAAKAFGRPFLFRFDWEMNGDWFPWGAQAKASPSTFVAMWRHFHDVVTAQGATNVTWVWCPNIDYPGATPLDQLYPGDTYVDWTCMDGYNRGTNPLKPVAWQSFTDVMQPTYKELLTLAPDKPVAIAETASTEYGGSKAAWITSMLTDELPHTFPHIKAVSWFNWNVNEDGGDWDWPIESSPAAQAAFAKGIASPYYRTNNYGNLPLLTKVPIP